jgi:hypothetical protein
MQCLIARGIKHMLWGFKSSDPNNMTLDCLQAGSKQIVADFSLTPKRIWSFKWAVHKVFERFLQILCLNKLIKSKLKFLKIFTMVPTSCEL